MRKFTSREKAIIKRIIELHTAHPWIPVPVIYEKDVVLKDCDYEGSRKEAIKNIVTNYNKPYIYESANLINVLEENGYLLLDKEHNDNAYRDEIATYTQYISDMQAAGWSYEDDDAFPLKALFGRISPKLANILLKQIYANALVFDSLKELADDEFLTEEGQLLKQSLVQSQYAESTLNEAKKQTTMAQTTVNEAKGQTAMAQTTLKEAKEQTKLAQSTLNEAKEQTAMAQTTLKEAKEQTKLAQSSLNEAKEQTKFAIQTFEQSVKQSKKADKQVEIAIIQTKIARLTTIVAITTMVITAIPSIINIFSQKESVTSEHVDTLTKKVQKTNDVISKSLELHKEDIIKSSTNKYETTTIDTLNPLDVNKNK